VKGEKGGVGQKVGQEVLTNTNFKGQTRDQGKSGQIRFTKRKKNIEGGQGKRVRKAFRNCGV